MNFAKYHHLYFDQSNQFSFKENRSMLQILLHHPLEKFLCHYPIIRIYVLPSPWSLKRLVASFFPFSLEDFLGHLSGFVSFQSPSAWLPRLESIDSESSHWRHIFSTCKPVAFTSVRSCPCARFSLTAPWILALVHSADVYRSWARQNVLSACLCNSRYPFWLAAPVTN